MTEERNSLEGWREGDVALNPSVEGSAVAHHVDELVGLQ